MLRNLRFPLARSSTLPPPPPPYAWRSQWIKYSTLGTSGTGKSQLTMPDHLGDQEKGIFEKLAGELKPTRLEVFFHFHFPFFFPSLPSFLPSPSFRKRRKAKKPGSRKKRERKKQWQERVEKEKHTFYVNDHHHYK